MSLTEIKTNNGELANIGEQTVNWRTTVNGKTTVNWQIVPRFTLTRNECPEKLGLT